MPNRLQELNAPLGMDDPKEWLHFSEHANIKLSVSEVKRRVALEAAEVTFITLWTPH